MNINHAANLLTSLTIGNQKINNRLIVAPMAGVTDNPFRRLCKNFGAGHAVSEMIIADSTLQNRQKSLYRTNFGGEINPISAQIVGSDPNELAKAARFQVNNGALIVDINMGCPAKKVCRKLAGSALLQDLDLVKRLLDSVVAAVDVPVTLKTRLGFANGQENILTVAKIAENAGIAALTIHGRTREDFYHGSARYELIAQVKEMISIPIIVNGDIDSPEKALQVWRQTKADALMIGRAAQGKPWIFRDISHFIAHHSLPAALTLMELQQIILWHLDELYRFYGEYTGCRIARKHIAWYTQNMPSARDFCQMMYQCQSSSEQYRMVERFFVQLFADFGEDSAMGK